MPVRVTLEEALSEVAPVVQPLTGAVRPVVAVVTVAGPDAGRTSAAAGAVHALTSAAAPPGFFDTSGANHCT